MYNQIPNKMYAKIDIDDGMHERIVKYANDLGLKMPRAYSDLLNIALEKVEADGNPSRKGEKA